MASSPGTTIADAISTRLFDEKNCPDLISINRHNANKTKKI